MKNWNTHLQLTKWMFSFDWCHGLKWLTLSMFVDCHDAKFVFSAFVQILGHGLRFLDHTRDLLPALRALGPLLQDVALNLGTTIVFGRLPLQGNGVSFDSGWLQGAAAFAWGIWVRIFSAISLSRVWLSQRSNCQVYCKSTHRNSPSTVTFMLPSTAPESFFSLMVYVPVSPLSALLRIRVALSSGACKATSRQHQASTSSKVIQGQDDDANDTFISPTVGITAHFKLEWRPKHREHFNFTCFWLPALHSGQLPKWCTKYCHYYHVPLHHQSQTAGASATYHQL